MLQAGEQQQKNSFTPGQQYISASTDNKNDLSAYRTNDCIRNEDVKKAIAVEVELKKCWHSLAGCDSEFSIAVCTAGHVDAVPQQVERTHDHILRVPWKAQIEVPWQDLLLHVEKVFHQLGENNPLVWRIAEAQGYLKTK